MARSEDPTYRLLCEHPSTKLKSQILPLIALSPVSSTRSTNNSAMGVTRKVLKEGNGTDKPKKGDDVTIEYTGNLYDEAQASNEHRGKQ